MKKQVTIIDYGAGNIQSIQFALNRIGVSTSVTNNLELIEASDRVILPGVGHALPALESLELNGLLKLIPSLQQPVLGICLGMQLMCKFLEENDRKGLDMFSVDVVKFSAKEKVPHMGWNTINTAQNLLFQGIPSNAYVYFVHSYFATLNNQSIANTTYGIEFSAALQSNNFYGCQFHPEKSGKIGQQILKNFIELT